MSLVYSCWASFPLEKALCVCAPLFVDKRCSDYCGLSRRHKIPRVSAGYASYINDPFGVWLKSTRHSYGIFLWQCSWEFKHTLTYSLVFFSTIHFSLTSFWLEVRSFRESSLKERLLKIASLIYSLFSSVFSFSLFDFCLRQFYFIFFPKMLGEWNNGCDGISSL